MFGPSWSHVAAIWEPSWDHSRDPLLWTVKNSLFQLSVFSRFVKYMLFYRVFLTVFASTSFSIFQKHCKNACFWQNPKNRQKKRSKKRQRSSPNLTKTCHFTECCWWFFKGRLTKCFLQKVKNSRFFDVFFLAVEFRVVLASTTKKWAGLVGEYLGRGSCLLW